MNGFSRESLQELAIRPDEERIDAALGKDDGDGAGPSHGGENSTAHHTGQIFSRAASRFPLTSFEIERI